MTVMELMIMFESVDLEATVFEERDSELREVRPDDVRFDPSPGRLPISDADVYGDEDGAQPFPHGVLILKAWS